MSVFDLQSVAGPGGQYRFASFSAAPRARVRGHAHDGWHVLALIAGGLEEETGSAAARMDPSVVRVSRPGATHAIDFAADGARCLVLHVGDERLARRLALNVARGAPSAFIESPEVARLLAEAQRGAGRLETSLAGDLALRRAVAQLSRLCKDPAAPPPPPWLEEARAELLDAAVPVSAAARRRRFSREHLARAFALHFGLSPREFRSRAALSRALGLVAREDASLAAAAQEAGFFDQSHFSNALRAHLEMTPGDAARRIRAASHSYKT